MRDSGRVRVTIRTASRMPEMPDRPAGPAEPSRSGTSGQEKAETGRTDPGGTEEDRALSDFIVTEAEGTCRRIGGKYHILYEEPQESRESVRCHIAVGRESAEVHRRGAVKTDIRFAGNYRHRADYETEEGILPLEFLTRELTVTEEESGLTVRILYRILLGGRPVTENRVEMKIEDAAEI